MRVVSLTCSNTEIVSFLGLGDLLVGVDDHSDYPPEVVEPLPRVGPDLDIDVSKVAALEPDLVLASLTVPGHEKVVERIDAAGFEYLAPAPQSLEDVADDIATVAEALGHAERGGELAEEWWRRLREHERPAAEGGRPAVLVQWWPKPVIAPGRRSWVQGLLELCGAANPLAGEDVESRPLEEGELAELDPDVVALSWCGVEAHKVRPDVVREDPALASVRAIAADRVACIPEAWLGRPSPRLVWGAWALASLVDSVRSGGPLPEALSSPEASAEALRSGGRWPEPSPAHS